MDSTKARIPALEKLTKILLSLALLAGLTLAVSACSDRSSGGSGKEPGCVDADGDGFGVGCSAGPDCVDFNASIHECDCSVDNYAGCDCQGNASEACFDGEANKLGVGVCAAGTRTCDNGKWTACVGQIPPLPESCNSRDDDCDGQIDNGLAINRCGTCDPQCDFDTVSGGDGPPTAADWDLNDDNSDGVEVADDGSIQLTREGLDLYFLWIANSEEGTVSKVDTRTGAEVARYVSAVRVDPNMPSSTARCPLNSSTMPPGNCPSRTAVDLVGNVWIANRAFAGQGSVTKIAHRDCIDRNGNGTIETSSDVNGNGRIETSDPQEFFGENDECILFTVTIGGNQGIPRALAIDPFAPVRGVGSVWVGAWNENRYYQIAADDGSLVKTVDVPHRPYGAVMDRFGILWSSDCDCFGESNAPDPSLISIVSMSGQVGGPFRVRSTSGCANSYGITIDRNDHVWVGGFECEAAFRYDPPNDSWLTVPLGAGSGLARGVAADRDGWVYVGSSHDNRNAVGHVSKFRDDGSNVSRYTFTNQASGTIGVGLDADGRVWGVNQATGSASRINPRTDEIQHFPVGDGPYTYSDFTGYTLRNFTAPQGHYRRRLTGCPNNTRVIWLGLDWEGETPVGTDIQATVRVGDDEIGLAASQIYGPWDDNPVDLRADGVPPAKYLEVEFILISDVPDMTPVLRDFEVTWTCPGAD